MIFAVIGGLAALLAVRTLLRQRARYHFSPRSLGIGRRVLPWAEVAAVRLRHFATRRSEPGGGWMELRISGPAGRIVLDSDLDGFLDVARAAHGAARANGLALDEASQDNFRALGLD